jgi:hypothetical protein
MCSATARPGTGGPSATPVPGCGLEVEDLIELKPEPGATAQHLLATFDWARRWPCEEVWKARKRA